jgi:hypothetical protein
MEVQSILIFALVGAVCLFVMTGGLLSMSDTEPTPGYLTAGAALGGAAGAAVAYASGYQLPASDKLLSAALGSVALPQMQVGLPAF